MTESRHQQLSGCLRAVSHFPRFARIHGKRFFAEDVRAIRQGQYRDREMVIGRGADVNHIESSAFQE
jgi:hypothetical protein